MSTSKYKEACMQFGVLETNATCAMSLKVELEKQGYSVHLGMLDMKETLKNMHTVAWVNKESTTHRNKEGVLCWCEVHEDEIYMSLGDALDYFMFINEY